MEKKERVLIDVDEFNRQSGKTTKVAKRIAEYITGNPHNSFAKKKIAVVTNFDKKDIILEYVENFCEVFDPQNVTEWKGALLTIEFIVLDDFYKYYNGLGGNTNYIYIVDICGFNPPMKALFSRVSKLASSGIVSISRMGMDVVHGVFEPDEKCLTKILSFSVTSMPHRAMIMASGFDATNGLYVLNSTHSYEEIMKIVEILETKFTFLDWDENYIEDAVNKYEHVILRTVGNDCKYVIEVGTVIHPDGYRIISVFNDRNISGNGNQEIVYVSDNGDHSLLVSNEIMDNK